jgi:ATP-dependent helicase/nuclease subunit B
MPNCITLPAGTRGWNEKVRIIEQLLAPGADSPAVFSNVLILVGSSRMKRTYGGLFLDMIERTAGLPALVPPSILTLPQFAQQLSASRGKKRLIDETARLVLLEGIVRDQLVRFPEFRSRAGLLAPSLSAAIAEMIEQLASAGVTPDRLRQASAEADYRDKPQVRLLLDAYGRYRAALAEKHLLDPQGLMEEVTTGFDPAWLAPYSRVLVDGIHDADALQAELLRTIASHTDCTFLVEAPSADAVMQAPDFHPLHLLKQFLASLGLSPETSCPADADDLHVSRTLFSDRPFAELAASAPETASFRKNIRLLSAISPREEVSLIARKIKTSFLKGTAPDSVLVTFPSLDEYGPLVEEIFSDYGIPYNRALGRRLSSSPVATGLMSLLQAQQDDFSGQSLTRIVSAPLLRFGAHAGLAPSLDRFLRERRIIGGKSRIQAALAQPGRADAEREMLSAPMAELFGALAPFETEEAVPLDIWMRRLAELIAWSGIELRVGAIRGPLNSNLQAWEKMNEARASLASAGALLPEYRCNFREWLFLLKRTFMRTRFQVPAEDESGVQILGLEESAGRPWSELFLGGMTNAQFPPRAEQNIFLPQSALEALGVRAAEHDRLESAHHFFRLVLSAPEVTLTYPENANDRPLSASPFLEELTPLRIAGLMNRGIERASGMQFALTMQDSRSAAELAKALAISKTTAPLPQAAVSALPALAGIQAALADRPADKTISAPDKREFSVTELDDYLRCPYDYYVKHVLHTAPLETVSEDITARERGSAIHAILRNFYLSWHGPINTENRNAARALLAQLAAAAFAREADTFRNRREKDFFLSIVAERFLDAEAEFWSQGFRPAYLEHKATFSLDLGSGTAVTLSGKIDRIDVDAQGNFIIVDYKTGMYPLPKMEQEQDIFQLPVYAIMTQEALRNGEPALRRPVGLAYYDLANVTGAGARDMVLYDAGALQEQPSSKPKASPRSTQDFAAILAASIEKAATAARGIRAGAFSTALTDPARCRSCPSDLLCGEEE